MTQVKIAVVGAAGRMGQEITRAIVENKNSTMGAAIEYEGCPLLGQDIGTLCGIDAQNVSLTSDLATAAAACDVILDVSLPTATDAVIEMAKKLKKPLACGTTGVSDSTLQKFSDAATEIPVIHTKNFSMGIAVLSALAKKAAAILGQDYDIEVIEKHHNRKIDAPSGTAQILADAMMENPGEYSCVYGREGNTGERPTGEIGIHAIRGGGIFGEHTVMFIGQNERLELGHVVHTRSLLAEGAVKTAIIMATAKVGLHTMAGVLGLNE